MLVFRGRIENSQAIISIGFQPFVPEIGSVGQDHTPIHLPIREYRALIDTGAQRTCLSRKVIAFERMQKHGKRFIQNVHSQAVHYLYWARLGLWANGTDADMSVTRTYFALPTPVEVIDIADNAAFDGILGMDVLQLCDLRMERSGHFEVRMS